MRNFLAGPVGIGKSQIAPYNTAVGHIQEIGGTAQHLTEPDNMPVRYCADEAIYKMAGVIGSLMTLRLVIIRIGYH